MHVGLITARGGSKGVPRKNLADLGGKSLLAWTIEAAKESGLDRIMKFQKLGNNLG
jgi:N-acylneuraminate cytidylyltransferase